MTKEHPVKEYPTIACCGLDCGLCPTYYTEGPSRCPGCCGQNFFNKHPSCSIITCCVKEHSFETCAECKDFPCSKIDKWDKMDSFISHRVSLSNLRLIKKRGLDKFLTQQQKRIDLLENLLENFNEGRSKSFYCLATALLPIEELEMLFTESVKDQNINTKDIKSKSKILRENFTKLAKDKSTELKLRRK